MSRVTCVALVTVLTACAHTPTYEPADPLEPVNRQIYRFNDAIDRYALRPVAQGYQTVTPQFVRTGVTNFFDNLTYPITIVNQFMQGKPATGAQDFARFLVNSTFGVAGLFDPADGWGLAPHNEDFGQTFGVWGVGQGWYLMLPVLGPSTNRDLSGRLVGSPLNPIIVIDSTEARLALNALDIVNTRAILLSTDQFVRDAHDPYVFLRDAYLQRRRAVVYDGEPPSEEPAFDMDDLDL